jgi:hypothetical protein
MISRTNFVAFHAGKLSFYCVWIASSFVHKGERHETRVPWECLCNSNAIERYKTKNPQSHRRNAGFVDDTELHKTKLWCRKPESNRHDVATAGF